MREFLRESVLHCYALYCTWRIGRPGNSLISKGLEVDIAD